MCRNTEVFVWMYLIFSCAVAAVSVVVFIIFYEDQMSSFVEIILLFAVNVTALLHSFH